MAIQDKNTLKSYFNTGDRPTEQEFADVIDSVLNVHDDKADTTVTIDITDDTLFITPKSAKKLIDTHAVTKINNLSPDATGNLQIENITGTAGSITGSIEKSQVTDLQAELGSKLNLDSLKTINNQSLIGSGNITVATGGNFQQLLQSGSSADVATTFEIYTDQQILLTGNQGFSLESEDTKVEVSPDLPLIIRNNNGQGIEIQTDDLATYNGIEIATVDQIPNVTGFVPYTGVTQDVNLGNRNIKASYFYANNKTLYDSGNIRSINTSDFSIDVFPGNTSTSPANLTFGHTFNTLSFRNASGTRKYVPLVINQNGNSYNADSSGVINLPTLSETKWGQITGTLSAQTDLQTAFNGKFNNPTGTTNELILGNGIQATRANVVFSTNSPAIVPNNVILSSGSQSNINNSFQGQLNSKIGSATGSPVTVKDIWVGSQAEYATATTASTTVYMVQKDDQEFKGSLSVSASGTTTIFIPHSLGVVPSFLSVAAKSPNAGGILSYTATSNQIQIIYSTAPTGTLQYWIQYNS